MGFACTVTMLHPISFQISITTIQTFQKSYVTFLYLKGVKKYNLSKFEACCAGRILFRVSVRVMRLAQLALKKSYGRKKKSFQANYIFIFVHK